jgi:hypothetical protein
MTGQSTTPPPLPHTSRPFAETASGHRCNTWRFAPSGKGGRECDAGFVLWPHQWAAALLRGERVRAQVDADA